MTKSPQDRQDDRNSLASALRKISDGSQTPAVTATNGNAFRVALIDALESIGRRLERVECDVREPDEPSAEDRADVAAGALPSSTPIERIKAMSAGPAARALSEALDEIENLKANLDACEKAAIAYDADRIKTRTGLEQALDEAPGTRSIDSLIDTARQRKHLEERCRRTIAKQDGQLKKLQADYDALVAVNAANHEELVREQGVTADLMRQLGAANNQLGAARGLVVLVKKDLDIALAGINASSLLKAD